MARSTPIAIKHVSPGSLSISDLFGSVSLNNSLTGSLSESDSSHFWYSSIRLSSADSTFSESLAVSSSSINLAGKTNVKVNMAVTARTK